MSARGCTSPQAPHSRVLRPAPLLPNIAHHLQQERRCLIPLPAKAARFRRSASALEKLLSWKSTVTEQLTFLAVMCGNLYFMGWIHTRLFLRLFSSFLLLHAVLGLTLSRDPTAWPSCSLITSGLCLYCSSPPTSFVHRPHVKASVGPAFISTVCSRA